MDKALLLKSRLPEADVELPGVGTVRVRGLSRAEALHMPDVGTSDFEVFLLALAMVDPSMTEDDIRAWQAASPPGELDPVIDKVSELSGMAPGSEKEAYKSVPDETGAGVRVLPGAEAGDDGGPTAGGDEQ